MRRGAANALLLLVLGDIKWAGIAVLIFSGVLGSLGGSAAQAMVADLVPPERHETAYAAVRVAANFGIVIGPPLGALLLVLGSWSALFSMVAVLSALGWLVGVPVPAPRWSLRLKGATAKRLLRGNPRRQGIPAVPRLRRVRLARVRRLRGRAAGVAGGRVRLRAGGVGIPRLDHPLFVTLFQLRLTRFAAPFAAAPKLVVALLLMGLPYLLLVATHSLAAIVVVLTVFVIGEMLWVPTSQAVVAELAPPDIRGAYMGAFGSAPAIGFALAPLIGLQIRNSFGDDATWILFASIGVVAAALGGLALAGVRRRVGGGRSAVLKA